MSLPIAGKPRPDRPATHTPLDLDRLMKLGVAVEDAAEELYEEGEPVTPDMLEELAGELGVDVSHLLAATVMTTDLEVERDAPVTFVACAGGCQSWGALDLIERLYELRRARAEGGKPLFNIHARNCLDKCQQAPVLMAHGPGGIVIMPESDCDQLDAVVSSLCDAE